MSTTEASDEYLLVDGAPSAEDYLNLRSAAGLTPRRLEQAGPALAGSWKAVHVRHRPSGNTVAMGRVIGDGGWYFHVVDMAVLPQHQRRGLGDKVLTALMTAIRNEAPSGAYVNLLADPPGMRLYERHGFGETAPHSVGMAQTITTKSGSAPGTL